MTKFAGFLILFASFATLASGTIDFLDVNNGIVSFSTTEAKTVVSPACVASEAANLWTVSLASESGRATYTMLVTALSTGVAVKVESALDCAYVPGTERALRVWFEKE